VAQKFTVPITVKQLASAGSDAVTVYVDQDTFSRLKVEAGGRLTWGGGASAGDVNLYRASADVLQTDDTFKTPVLFVDSIEIDPTGATTDQVLKFDGTKFVPGTASTVGSIDDLSDVVITSPEEFQTLEYNGTNWVNTYSSVVSYVRNAEATTLTTGTAVYLFGATGDHATVKRADNNSDATSSKTIGLVGANITASNNGPVVTRGYVDGINLSVGYTAGDILWLGENGAFTKTKPTAPDHLVFIGVVVRATNNGIVYVATQNGYELDELHDVSIPSPNVGDVLTYNGSLWTAASAGGGASLEVSATAPASPEVGDLWFNSATLETYIYYDNHWLQASGEPDLVEDLTDLSDVTLTTPVNGQFLKFDGTRWVNGTIPTINTLDDIGDVSVPSPSNGQFLKWNGTAWVPDSIPTINALDDIGDVSAASPSSGQFLKWNGTAWVPETIIGGATISDTAPASPLAGQLWFQSTNGKTFVYYDSSWIEVGGVGTGARMVSSSSAPASPLEGSMWFDTDTAQTFVYYDSQWIEIGASGVTASVQDSAPAAPVSGQIWFNSLTGGTYVYYGTNWIEVGASPFSALVNTINAKGDLLVGTADNTIGGLTAGSAGQVLTVDSSTATGLKWDTPVSTGKAIAMAIVFGG
jgi:hypothetical protein